MKLAIHRNIQMISMLFQCLYSLKVTSQVSNCFSCGKNRTQKKYPLFKPHTICFPPEVFLMELHRITELGIPVGVSVVVLSTPKPSGLKQFLISINRCP